ncbi:hypothetical protein BS50DRAFT_592119 [Corynespora cassiicola Philippines]|uniref:Uncharacterized protein n=1 Tax=Corynespora cassiicola Philippines TaxID=1448308 RepID=A0A2T2NCV6_CORCC|nr:hypothetical protein BS50DRAFT_592119 [Corynespora cassiicola Philippines]
MPAQEGRLPASTEPKPTAAPSQIRPVAVAAAQARAPLPARCGWCPAVPAVSRLPPAASPGRSTPTFAAVGGLCISSSLASEHGGRAPGPEARAKVAGDWPVRRRSAALADYLKGLQALEPWSPGAVGALECPAVLGYALQHAALSAPYSRRRSPTPTGLCCLPSWHVTMAHPGARHPPCYSPCTPPRQAADAANPPPGLALSRERVIAHVIVPPYQALASCET